MPKIIVSSRYMKNSPKHSAKNLLKYMATREGVELTQQGIDRSRIPWSTMELVFQLARKYPEIYDYPERITFENSLTVDTANELFDAFVERNADRWGDMKALVNYMAKRPGVDKLGTHGLFSQTDDKIDLEKVAEEVGQHKGNIWTHVVSLRREDAERLGYNNATAWRDLVRRNVAELAQAMKIDLDNLQWYGAFHNTAHHPHIHLLVYAKDARQGWLTKAGIEQLKRTFGGDIFRNEQYMLFTAETRQRDLLKEKVDQLLETSPVWPMELRVQMLKLARRLVEHKGKKSYGYLKKKDKELVDSIVRMLAADPQVADLYREWDRINREKLSLYYEKRGDPTPLEQNREFRSLKNAVIRSAGLLLMEEAPTRTAQHAAVGRALTRILESFCTLVQDSGQRHQQKLQGQIDRKLWEKIAEKRAAHGWKVESLREYDDGEEEMGLRM